jgi:hypothetical protein
MSINIEQLKSDLTSMLNIIDNKIGNEKHIKSASLELRNQLTHFKKNITPYKRELMRLDKEA